MKQIQAYIKKHKLNTVVTALRKIPNLTGLSVLEREGYGLGWSQCSDLTQEMMTGIKLEIFCKDDVVEDVVTAIGLAAHTGLKGDGKIYVNNIEDAVRISSGERGKEAV